MNESEPNMPKKCPQCGAPLPTGALEGLCPACLLKEGTKETATQPEMPAFDPPPIEEIAKLFPQLEIIALIGKGGMGAVYKARQVALDRLVALKILPPQIATGPGFAERFTREARALARLSHPNIVGIYEFGQVNNLPFFIMEFVDGANLRDLERAGKLSPREALQIVPQICEALQFAHDEGIVHRDIKPENILLDKRGRVKIADFGIAKIMGRAAEAALTETRGVIGTPQYMAPEQVETPQTVDHRADIFSLGVVFYEMLTGELPLGKFSPPSRKVHVDVRLDEVVLRTLEKEPERRYQQASQVKTAVETIGSGLGTPLPSSTPGEDANALASQVIARNFALDIGSCVRRGWALVKSDFWPIIGVNALIWVLFGAASSVGAGASGGFWAGTSVIGILLSGPLIGGLNFYFLKKIRGESPTIETAFSGFSNRVVHLFLGSFVADTLTWIGFFCFVLPGIYLMVAWVFTLPLIIDKRLDFWPAMITSMKIVNKRWWRFLAALLVFVLVGISGVLACGLGLFITVPIGIAALMFAYEDVFGAVQPVPSGAPVGTGPSGTVVAPGSEGAIAGTGWKPKKPVIIAGAGAAVFVAFLVLISAHSPRGHLRMPRPPHIPAVVRHHSGSSSAIYNPSSPAEQPVSQEGFGAIQELVVTDAVNFATGKLMAMPEENTNADFSERIARNIRQAELLGVDAYAEGTPPKLYTLGMALAELTKDDWDTATTDQVHESVASAATDGAPIVVLQADDGPSAPYAFKTREGAFGVLQVMGSSEEPRGIKLRYKLLRDKEYGTTSDDFWSRLAAAKIISGMQSKDTALAGIAKDAAKAGDVTVVREALNDINLLTVHDQAARDSVRFLAKRGMRNQAIEIAKTIHNVAVQDAALAELAK